MEEKDRSDQELVLTDGSAEDALVAERIAAAAYEPPSTLRTGVWLRINAERKRRRRQRFIRYAGVAACLLIMLPAAVRIVPRFLNASGGVTKDAVAPTAAGLQEEAAVATDGSGAEQDSLPMNTLMNASNVLNVPDGGEETVEPDLGVMLFSAAPETAPAAATTVPTLRAETSAPTVVSYGGTDGLTAGGALDTAPQTTVAMTSAAATTPAPRLMLKSIGPPAGNNEATGAADQENGVETTAAASEAKASSLAEDAAGRAATVLRAMESAVSYDEFLVQKPTGSPYAYIRQYGVTRAAFLEAAGKLGVSFTDAELAELFGEITE